MKKILLTTCFAFAFAGAAFSQSPNGPGNGSVSTSQNCVNQSLDDLRNCLLSKNVSFNMIQSLNPMQMYLYIAPGTPQGKVTSCIMQYNNGTTNCPSALPIIIM